ncbi:MAG: 2-oxoacid:acceptor oxidoreductase family protein [Deltaproteobacteria bacterium]|nr:2-oxoacid:acceptor oxidoreductase family protein [Deltaproteobacteria bacterium]
MTEATHLRPDLSYEFCPGCTHGLIVDALGGSFANLGLAREDLVLVSDIGCVGLIDKYFDLATFHGLHGRSITYAAGLKLVRPDLQIVVAIGDGGCGIGGHHLIQAARRGLDLTVLVFNNFNYGMTGGEHSSTTPLGARTSTTREGNLERPLDLCALARAAGATFVARAPAFDPDLKGLVARAIAHPGFALIDVWEICTAYFMPMNAFKKKQLLELSEHNRMPFGLLHEETPAPRAAAPRRDPPPRVGLSVEFRSELAAPRGVLIAGSAGQKVKSAATMLARAAIRSGLHATQKDDYPITVKTGHSVSEVVLSPRPIRFTGIEVPDLAVVLTADGLKRSKKALEQMPAGAWVIAEKTLALPPLAARRVELDLIGAAQRVGKENVALWALAETLRITGGVTGAALADTVERFTPERYRQAALAAVSG